METRSVSSRLLFFFLIFPASQVTGCSGGGTTSQDSGTWTGSVQPGTPMRAEAFGIAMDASSNVCVAGCMEGNLGERRMPAAKTCSSRNSIPAGTGKWVRLLGTAADEYGCAVTVDRDGFVYVSGDTMGSLVAANSGGSDAIPAKYDGNGERLWTRQPGSAADDYCNGIAVDPVGDLFLAGSTCGDLDGNTNAGGVDAFVAKFDSGGNMYRGAGRPTGSGTG